MGTQRVKEYQEPEEKKSLDDVRDKEETKAEKSEKVFRSKPKRVRGKKYLELRSLVQDNKFYPAGEAFDLVKKASFTKFDPSVEVHIKLKLKAGQTVRGMVNLPHGAGKEPKVAIFNENMLSEIQKSKLDFDILVAKPQDMPLLIKVAKILGPKGKMPTPKAGTVTENPEELIKKIKSGQVEYKADAQGIVHQIIGKASWEKQKLIENYNALLEVLKQYNPISIAICTTMGPSVKIEVM